MYTYTIPSILLLCVKPSLHLSFFVRVQHSSWVRHRKGMCRTSNVECVTNVIWNFVRPSRSQCLRLSKLYVTVDRLVSSILDYLVPQVRLERWRLVLRTAPLVQLLESCFSSGEDLPQLRNHCSCRSPLSVRLSTQNRGGEKQTHWNWSSELRDSESRE